MKFWLIPFQSIAAGLFTGNVLKVTINERWSIIVVVLVIRLFSSSTRHLPIGTTIRGNQILQESELLRTDLLENFWEQLRQVLDLRFSNDRKQLLFLAKTHFKNNMKGVRSVSFQD